MSLTVPFKQRDAAAPGKLNASNVTAGLATFLAVFFLISPEQPGSYVAVSADAERTDPPPAGIESHAGHGGCVAL